MNQKLIDQMATPETCDEGHFAIVYDSHYGDYTCPVCDAFEEILPDEAKSVYVSTIATLESRINDYIHQIEVLEARLGH